MEVVRDELLVRDRQLADSEMDLVALQI